MSAAIIGFLLIVIVALYGRALFYAIRAKQLEIEAAKQASEIVMLRREVYRLKSEIHGEAMPFEVSR